MFPIDLAVLGNLQGNVMGENSRPRIASACNETRHANPVSSQVRLGNNVFQSVSHVEFNFLQLLTYNNSLHGRM